MEGCEMLREFRVFSLLGHGLSPVQSQIEVRSPVVNSTELSSRTLVFVKKTRCGFVQTSPKNAGFGVVRMRGQMLKRYSQCQKFSQAIPAQVVFFVQLLYVLWCRTAGTRFKQPASIHEGNDGQHLR